MPELYRMTIHELHDLLQIPAGREVESIVAIGYPAAAPAGHSRASLLFERVHREKYQKKDTRP